MGSPACWQIANEKDHSLEHLLSLFRCIALATFAALLPTEAIGGVNEGLLAYARGDYRGALSELTPAAQSGDSDAQYTLGRMYANGEGVFQDFIEAHKWFNLAAAKGRTDARSARDRIAAQMTSSQIAQAQAKAREWSPRRQPVQSTASQPTSQRRTTAASSTSKPSSTSDLPAPSRLSKRELVRHIQRMLNELGYDAGTADGLMGGKTRNAIRSFQAHSGVTVSGEPSADLYTALGSDLGYTIAASSATSSGVQTAASAQATPAPANVRQPPAGQPGSTQDERLHQFATDLREITRQGRANRAASSTFLQQIDQLIDRYDNPWQRLVLNETFDDANALGRLWRLRSGQYSINSRGRLISTIELTNTAESRELRGEDLPLAILGAILSQSGGNRSPGSQPAVIDAERPFANAFSVSFEARSRVPRNSPREFGNKRQFSVLALDTRTQQSRGYELRFVFDNGPNVLLVSHDGRGERILASGRMPHDLTQANLEQLLWQRTPAGTMVVSVGGYEVIQTTHRSQYQFDRLRIRNVAGRLDIDDVTVRDAS